MPLLFVNTLEFYAIAFAVMVAIVALLVRPSEKGAATTSFCHGDLQPPCTLGEESLEIASDSYGRLHLAHRNVVLPDGHTLNCSISIEGKDIKITEKPACSDPSADPNRVLADVYYHPAETLRGRFHIHFESPATGLWTAGYVRIPSDHPKTLFLRQ